MILTNSKKNIGAKSSDFYCLQPLVVKETIPDTSAFFEALPKEESDMALQVTRDAISNNTRWEVIDGQQRLTTIFRNYILFTPNIRFLFERVKLLLFWCKHQILWLN